MAQQEDIELAPGLRVPARDLEWRFSTSGGPGGQHANRSNTRVELRLDLPKSSLPSHERDRLIEELSKRAPQGVVAIVVDETRSQSQNRKLARARLQRLLQQALEEPKQRTSSTPPPSARRRRLRDKRIRSELKRLRRRPTTD